MPRVISHILTACLLFSLTAGIAAFANPPQHAASGTLHNLMDTLKDFRLPPGQVRKQQTPAALRRQAADFRDELYQLDAQLLADFARDEARLYESDMPPGLLQRHQDSRELYRQRMGELLDRLNALAVAGDNDTAALAEQTLTWLAALQSPAKPPAFDPANLPWRQPPAQIRAPLENKEDIDQLFPPAAVNVAGTALTTLMPDLIAAAHGAPGDDDKAATTEAQITQDILDLADNLGNHPVRIYEWVRANIEFIPTYGSVQGSQLTLELRRGNAFDMTSLFIALLRAAQIPARYVCGTVTANIPQVISWLNVKTPARAAELMAQGGIPHTVITRGGEIIKLRFEHCWAKAWVDFIPSRGARHETGKGDSWATIDVAFKWYDYHDGIDLSAAVPFNADVVLDELLATVEYDADEGWLTGLKADYIKEVFAGYHADLDAYLQSNHLSAADTLPSRSVVYPRWAMLPSGLPFRVDAESAPLAALPNTVDFQHRFTFKLYRTATDQALDSPALSHTITLPEIGSKRLSLTWEPATAEDAAGLAAYRAEAGRTELPIHLFSLKPVLKLDDEVLANGPAVQMGSVQYYSLNFRDPHFNHGSQGILTAGDETVIGIDGNGLTPAVIEARMQRVDPNSSAAEQLHHTALRFWVEHDLLDEAAAQVHGVRTQRMPSAGLFSAPLNVSYVLGIPSSGNYRERRIDVKHNVQTVAAPDAQSRFDFMSHIGIHGSFLEGNVLDQLFGRSYGPAVSAVQVLMTANAQETPVPIYTVTPENLAVVMPQLLLNAGLEEEIAAAVNAGMHVIVPQSDVQIGNWIGSGYIVQDPLTGAGAYLLDGGLNGGAWEGCNIDIKPILGHSGFTAAQHSLFKEKQHKLLAELAAATTLAKKKEIQNRFDYLTIAFLTTWRSIWNFNSTDKNLTAFKIHGSGCLVPKARLASEYPGGPTHDLGFIARHFFMPIQTDNLVDLKAFPVGQVKCREYLWKIYRNTANGMEITHIDGPSNDKQFIQYPFEPAGLYQVKIQAMCEGADSALTGDIKIYVTGRPALIPNYDRDGDIDGQDKLKAKYGKTFYFWINDDADSGFDAKDKDNNDDHIDDDMSLTDTANANWREDFQINGERDLIDLFPVLIDFKEVLTYLSTQKYDFLLKHRQTALNAAFNTGLTDADADGYLFDTQFSYLAHKKLVEINKTGYVIPTEFLPVLSSGGLILLEGREAAVASGWWWTNFVQHTEEPLVLEIREVESEEVIYQVEMPLSLHTVRKMYRHLDLRKALKNTGAVNADFSEPANYPDALTNDKNLIFIHGYNVDKTSARGWHAEMFKRFYWAGSNAKFYAVSWWGDIGIPTNYQGSIVNAFDTSHYLIQYLNSLAGDNVIAAHSAGNIAASWAIAGAGQSAAGGLQVQNYFMLNAAVPIEAYDASAFEPYLIPKSWRNAPAENRSTDWYKLFLDANGHPAGDVRAELTWKNIFQAVQPVAYNFYSSGDQIFELYSDIGTLTGVTTDLDRYAWQKQEANKGRGLGPGETPYAGWGRNPEDSRKIDDSHPPQELRLNPLFLHSPQSVFPGPSSFTLTKFCCPPVDDTLYSRERFLAMAIPALSPAAGRFPIQIFEENNADMNIEMKSNGWPRSDNYLYKKRWLHSDLKNIAYLYTCQIFKEIVRKGYLQ